MTDNVVRAFSEEHVEQLTGLTLARLRYWDRTDFFVPSFADENRRLAFGRIYSFKDIAALRVISALRVRFNIPLQELRRVADKLRHLGDDLWTKTTLYPFNKTVVFKEPETELPREIVSGQYISASIDLSVVLSDTKSAVAKLNERPEEKIGRVERSRHVRHNAYVIAGTRIPTASIKRLRDAGYTVAQIIREYPDLTQRDVEAALAHEERTAA